MREPNHAYAANPVSAKELGPEWRRKDAANGRGVEPIVEEYAPRDRSVNRVEQHRSIRHISINCRLQIPNDDRPVYRAAASFTIFSTIGRLTSHVGSLIRHCASVRLQPQVQCSPLRRSSSAVRTAGENFVRSTPGTSVA